MSNSIPFSDSPRISVGYPMQPSETPQQPSQGVPRPSPLAQVTGISRIAPKPRNSESELASVDRLTPFPGNTVPPSPYRSIRSDQDIAPTTSSPVPSVRGLLAARPFPASPEGRGARALPAEGSISRNSSQQRVSFEASRVSVPIPNPSPRTNAFIHPLLREAASQTSQGIDSTMSKMNRSSESSAKRPHGGAQSPDKHHDSPQANSPSHSRAASPSRRFGWSPFHRAHADAFVPVDPFRLRTGLRRLSMHIPDIESHLQLNSTSEHNIPCFTTSIPCTPKGGVLSFLRDSRYFILDTLPRQLYLCLLLRLPSLYFSRIARLYEDAQLSKPDLESMIISYSISRQQEERERIVRTSPIPPGVHYHSAPLPFPDDWTSSNVSPALFRFKQSWEAFVDSLLREWKTLNLVSALLLSAIVSMFQTPTMADDPIIRTAALLSLTSALMSLLYGCMYIVRFGTMRSMHKATRWAEEAARTTTFILWNVWVLLAMPAVWLAWSMIFFIVAILAYVWKYGSSSDPTAPPLLSPAAALGARISVTVLFFLGFIYLILIIKTLYNYGRNAQQTLSGRMTGGTGLPDGPEDDVRGGSQREHPAIFRRDGDRDQESARGSRGRDRTRAQHTTEPRELPAMNGLGLTGLDEVARPSASDEMPIEKQQQPTVARMGT